MEPTQFDVAVIGSGPGGSVASTFLQRKGYRVLLLDREQFPRFHIGESLLPATQLIWEKLGIAQALEHSGHTFKYAGTFHIAPYPDRDSTMSTTTWSYNFPRRMMNPRQYSFHVERAVFDKQLQDMAVANGVTLWPQTAVEEVLFEGDRAVGLRLRRNGEGTQELRVPFVIDASGRRCVIARQFNCIENDPVIKSSAVFGHFRGVRREPGYRQGFFNGYFIENGWLWMIPLAGDIMSVGVVQNEPENLAWSNDPEEVLLAAINRYAPVRERFHNAVQLSRIRSIKGLAYQTTKFCGDGWLSIGDANFFVDPLYSSGVQIAHSTAEKAAETVDDFLRGNRDLRAIRRYETYIRRYRRNVFGPMRSLYRMMRHYRVIAFYVRSTGPWSNDYHNWFLRRINCWGSGFYGHYNWVSRILEATGNLTAWLYPPLLRLMDADGWKRYERNPCREPPLQIPKDPKLLSEDGSMTESGAQRPRHAPAVDKVPAMSADGV
jgi:flavin-dependent dehydrogenase